MFVQKRSAQRSCCVISKEICFFDGAQIYIGMLSQVVIYRRGAAFGVADV